MHRSGEPLGVKRGRPGLGTGGDDVPVGPIAAHVECTCERSTVAADAPELADELVGLGVFALRPQPKHAGCRGGRLDEGVLLQGFEHPRVPPVCAAGWPLYGNGAISTGDGLGQSFEDGPKELERLPVPEQLVGDAEPRDVRVLHLAAAGARDRPPKHHSDMLLLRRVDEAQDGLGQLRRVQVVLLCDSHNHGVAGSYLAQHRMRAAAVLNE